MESDQPHGSLVGGIAGSGKSLLCQALVNLLGGQHLSQDEVDAKHAGFAAIREDGSVALWGFFPTFICGSL